MNMNEQAVIEEKNVSKFRVDHVDVFLDDIGPGQGKITISSYDRNYSAWWGAMGKDTTLRQFISNINSDYFANNLMGSRDIYTMDVKKTFAALRKHIRTEMCLPWYKHLDFQKELRESLNDFQSQCLEAGDYANRCFVDNFYNSFVNNLYFHSIEDKYDRKEIEEEFNNISEYWYFIVEQPNKEYIWLTEMHKKLKTLIKKGKI